MRHERKDNRRNVWQLNKVLPWTTYLNFCMQKMPRLLKMFRSDKKGMYRDGEKILFDVITGFSAGSQRTSIYKCGIPSREIDNYLEKTLLGNYLVPGEKKESYVPTPKGQAYVHNHKFEHLLLTTGGDNDPYVESYSSKILNSQIEGFIFSLQSILEKAEVKEKMKIFNGKKREKYQIIEEILDKAVDGVKKSHLIPKEDGCNLSFIQLQNYLLNLGKTNMIALNDGGYKTTLKGQMFVISHELQQSFLETGGKEDPYLNPELIAQIEAALSLMLKVRIPPTTLVSLFEEPIIIGK
ncbi:MAG: hypothetical protein NTW30_05995 [Candidatus Aenigmarchaeota archaeon]|nr:hypothetical protein [Candidatus Aenigmarchaeota archaeon]